MSCCQNSYNGIPCCCPQGTTTTTTACPFDICCELNCEDATPCPEVYLTDCIIYDGPDYLNIGIQDGENYTEILEQIIRNIPICISTTTSTTSTSTSSTTTTTTNGTTSTTTSTSSSTTSTTSSTTSTTSSTTSTSSTTTSSTTTTTTAEPIDCFCLTWTAVETSSDTNISWIDCEGSLQSDVIPSGSLDVEVTRCGIDPTSDNPEVSFDQSTKDCVAQPNGTFVCVNPPCTLYYISVVEPFNTEPTFETDYTYTDCNTGEIIGGNIGLGSDLATNCIAVYAVPGSVGPLTYLQIDTIGCLTTTTTTIP
jgi:hypothetical protein